MRQDRARGEEQDRGDGPCHGEPPQCPCPQPYGCRVRSWRTARPGGCGGIGLGCGIDLACDVGLCPGTGLACGIGLACDVGLSPGTGLGSRTGVAWGIGPPCAFRLARGVGPRCGAGPAGGIGSGRRIGLAGGSGLDRVIGLVALAETAGVGAAGLVAPDIRAGLLRRSGRAVPAYGRVVRIGRGHHACGQPFPVRNPARRLGLTEPAGPYEGRHELLPGEGRASEGPGDRAAGQHVSRRLGGGSELPVGQTGPLAETAQRGDEFGGGGETVRLGRRAERP